MVPTLLIWFTAAVAEVCLAEESHGVGWQRTASHSRDVQRCPSPPFVEGQAVRPCSLSLDRRPIWGSPDFSGCTDARLAQLRWKVRANLAKPRVVLVSLNEISRNLSRLSKVSLTFGMTRPGYISLANYNPCSGRLCKASYTSSVGGRCSLFFGSSWHFPLVETV